MTSSRHDHAAAPATRRGTLTPPSVRAGTSSLGLLTGTLLSGIVVERCALGRSHHQVGPVDAEDLPERRHLPNRSGGGAFHHRGEVGVAMTILDVAPSESEAGKTRQISLLRELESLPSAPGAPPERRRRDDGW